MARLARWRVPLGFATAVAALVLARPTWASWLAGLAVASVGAGLRLWAAGHLEKSREVTTSGPYRWSRHPLYLGSAVLAAGVVLASRSLGLAVLTGVYLAATFWAAIRSEEAYLAHAFRPEYEAYRRSAAPAVRRFSLARAWRNREYRALAGLSVGFAFLAIRIVLSL